MSGIEWVEVRAPSVEEATAVALEELGLDSEDQADIEVLEQPTKGFLGMGGQDAVIRVKPKPGGSDRRRSRGGRRGGKATDSAPSAARKEPKEKESASRPAAKSNGGGRAGGDRAPRAKREPAEPRTPRPKSDTPREDDRSEMTVDEQAAEIKRFLTGLLSAFGLDGTVNTRIEEDVIYADVVGEQTEALVGPKGATVQATLELCRTIIQRRVQAGARIRLDIAGYNERRREALKIYAGRLAAKVLEDGGEVMLEPMNSAERKVVHDAIAEIEGVRSYSEGEEPRRSVVVSAVEE